MTGWIILAGLVAVMLSFALATALHARSLDPPLENEEYLARHPELRELKEEIDDE